jgi:hypothetical protein
MTKERLERTAGLILLGFAGLMFYEAALSVVQAITRRAEHPARRQPGRGPGPQKPRNVSSTECWRGIPRTSEARP